MVFFIFYANLNTSGDPDLLYQQRRTLSLYGLWVGSLIMICCIALRWAGQGRAGQCNSMQCKAIQGKRQGRAGQGKARQGKARQEAKDRAGQGRQAGRCRVAAQVKKPIKTRQKAGQGKTRQCKRQDREGKGREVGKGRAGQGRAGQASRCRVSEQVKNNQYGGGFL